MGALLGLVLAVLVSLPDEAEVLITFLSFGFGLLIWLMGWNCFDRHRTDIAFFGQYKGYMITKAIGDFKLYDEMSFQPEKGFPERLIQSIGLQSTRRYSSDTYISGKHKGVAFEQADIRNWNIEEFGRNRWIYCLEYSGTQYVIKTDFPHTPQTNMACGDMSFLIRGERFYTGNDEFDSLMKIYTADAERAGKLFTSEFQYRLLELYKSTQRRFLLTVKNGYLYLFIPDRKSPLKPRLFKRYTDEMRASILEELRIAGKIIDLCCTKSGMGCEAEVPVPDKFRN